MNYQDVFLKHDVNIRKIVISNPKHFYELPYAITKDVFSEAEQLAYITSESYHFDRFKFFDSLMKHSNKNEISATIFITFLLHYEYWSNHITDIINFITDHKDSKEMLLMLIDNYDKQQNLISNIANNLVRKYNIKVKLFDADVYERIAENGFVLFDEHDIEYFSTEHENAEENKKLFENTAYQYIKTYIEQISYNADKSWRLYGIPSLLIEYLTKENITSIFDGMDKTNEFHLKFYKEVFDWISRKNSNIDEEFAIEISTKYEILIPQSFTKYEKVIDHLTDTIDIKVDLENPYSHIDDGTWHELKKTNHKESILTQALKLESIIKNLNNIFSLEIFEPNPGSLPEGLVKDIFELHYDYILDALLLNRYTTSFIIQLFKEYLRVTDNEGKQLAFDRFMDLNFNRKTIIETFGDKKIRCPEYLDMLMTHTKGYGLMLVAEMIKHDQDEVINLL